VREEGVIRSIGIELLLYKQGLRELTVETGY
jgi:hypothetical protein